MKTFFTLLAVLMAAMFFGAGCGDQGPTLGSEGAYGGPCKADGSCDEGLQCVNHVCKDAS